MGMKGFYFSLDAMLALMVISAAFVLVIRANPPASDIEKPAEMKMIDVVQQKQYNIVYENLPSSSTQEEFNRGNFSGTTAGRQPKTGELAIGYLNGTNPTKGIHKDLLAYWRMDEEIVGEYMSDYSKNNNTGTNNNGVRTGTFAGVFSTKAFDFNNGNPDNNQYIEVEDHPTLNPGTESFSFFSWIKVEGNTDNWATIVDKYSGSDKSAYRLNVQPDGQLHLDIGDGSSDYDLETSSQSLMDNSWHFVGFTVNQSSDTTKLYVDGQQVETSNTPFSGSISRSQDLYLGAQAQTESLDGRLDEVMLFNKTLAASNVRNLYFNGEPFKAEYESHLINKTLLTDWHKLQINASIPSNTNLSARFQYINSTGTIEKETVIDIEGGFKNYSVNTTDTEDAKIIFNGTSESPAKSWRVESYTVFEKSRIATEKFNGTVLEKILSEYWDNEDEEVVCDQFFKFEKNYSLLISNSTKSERVCGSKITSDERIVRRIPIQDSSSGDLKGPKTATLVKAN